MYFQRPVVLLLGGLLTASSAGCSIGSALFTDLRPSQSAQQSSADRMLAIGRMFEDQGKLERAEAMYRGALKKSPRSAEARKHLADLQERRRAPQPGGSLIAGQPRSVQHPPAHLPAPSGHPGVALPQATVASPAAPKAAGTAGAVSPQPAVASKPANSSPQAAVPATSVSSSKSIPAQPAPAEPSKAAPVAAAVPELPPVTLVGEPAAVSSVVSLDQVLNAAEAPGTHTALLIEALHSGETPEAKCLAAALLGECAADDVQVNGALQKAGEAADDPCLVLAVVDSQLHRNVSHAGTALNLIRLLPMSDASVQIQGATTLRHFAGTECREECVKFLSTLLDSTDPEVRAAALLTLGDFGPLPAETLERLEKLSKDDASEAVRESAAASLARQVK
jgi:hypothetical protein